MTDKPTPTEAATPDCLTFSDYGAVGNSGFDYKTAADFLSGKTVSDEALRKFVAASRGAHDARAALHAKMLSLQGELASREAEIALLKRSLLDAEAAPQPSPKAAPVTQQAGYAEVIECGNSYAKVKLKGEAFGSTKVGDIFYTSPQPPLAVAAPVPAAPTSPAFVYAGERGSDLEGLLDGYDHGTAFYTSLQPAPAPLSDDTEILEWLLWKLPGDALRYVVGELADTSSGSEFRAAIDAAIAAQGGSDADA